ncbi:hypothetical protein BC938DRAFT_470691 [Jimgerdemannia flammicorona]|uniref:Uncharacterized protein n=1 Tax=Jimgerdemannia flammicorona TaxID=994334 RepID=A0A433Q9N0_9FUNG|nr:hypothetical protein BC938DRAFT_470691 [Jimgerdemannia flammicorona]
MFIYAELMQRQRIATDILQALLGEMGIQRPRAMNDTLASIYILWEVLEAWRQKADECPADSLEQDESVALQTQILRELEDGQLDELVWMVGALSGLVCGWLAKSMRRGDNRTSDGAAMLEIPLEDQAGGVVSEGLEVVHEVLFGVKQRHDERMDGSCARKTVDNIPSKWFLFVAALEVMEERELITQWDKVLRFVSVTEFIQRKGANW